MTTDSNSGNNVHAARDVMEEAWRIQEEASLLGFDWPDAHGVLAKVREETDEIEAALLAGDCAHAARELGDLLFVCVNLARFLRTRPEIVLEQACETFRTRFARLTEELLREGKSVQSCSIEELNHVWDRVKVLTHQSPNQRG